MAIARSLLLDRVSVSERGSSHLSLGHSRGWLRTILARPTPLRRDDTRGRKKWATLFSEVATVCRLLRRRLI